MDDEIGVSLSRYLNYKKPPQKPMMFNRDKADLWIYSIRLNSPLIFFE